MRIGNNFGCIFLPKDMLYAFSKLQLHFLHVLQVVKYEINNAIFNFYERIEVNIEIVVAKKKTKIFNYAFYQVLNLSYLVLVAIARKMHSLVNVFTRK